jgi:hypothetical protein
VKNVVRYRIHLLTWILAMATGAAVMATGAAVMARSPQDSVHTDQTVAGLSTGQGEEEGYQGAALKGIGTHPLESASTDQEMSSLERYADRLLKRFDKSPLFINILYGVILYSILSLVTLLIIILLNRRRLSNEQALREKLKEQYQQMLMEYLFEEEKRPGSLKSLEQIASNKFSRQILIDQMIDLSINLKGEIKEVIRELYLQLGLKQDSLEKAYSRKWHKNVKGFRELAFMNIRDATERIKECLNSGNEILRMEAQIAMVGLSEDNPYHFLDFMEKPFSIWEQVTLHELVIQHNLPAPSFKQWFQSKNLSVLVFALEMVAWFKQKEAGDEVMALFDHEDEEVRRTAYRVCGEIGLKRALPLLKERYDAEPYHNRKEILNTFAALPDEQYLDFLKSVLDKEEDVQLQIQATKAMENTDEPGISMLIKLMKSKSEYKNYQIIIRHVLDGRIY